MSTAYSNPRKTQLSSSFQPFYPVDPNYEYSSVQDDTQMTTEALYNRTLLGKMLIDSLVNIVIGKGLTPMPSPEVSILGWSDEETKRFINEANAYWRLVAHSPNYDYYGKDNQPSLQRICFKNILKAGDSLPHWGYRKLNDGRVVPYLQVISGRMVTQNYVSDTKTMTGGVYINPDTGRETGYNLRVIGQDRTDTGRTTKVNRYSKSGKLEFDLISINKPDPNIVRGVPILTALRDAILNFDKYQSNHLIRSAVQTFFTTFIEKDAPPTPGAASFKEKLLDNGAVDNLDGTERKLDIGAGYVIELEQGEHAKLVQSDSNAEDYSSYIRANVGMISAALGLSYEVVMSAYDSSYSASRATINATERNMQIIRNEFCDKFNNPCYRQVIELGILEGFIHAPHFFDSPMHRQAALACTWVGVTPIQVDPTKDVKAYAMAVENCFVPREVATRNLYGMDFEEVAEHLRKENEIIEQYGLDLNSESDEADTASEDDSDNKNSEEENKNSEEENEE